MQEPRCSRWLVACALGATMGAMSGAAQAQSTDVRDSLDGGDGEALPYRVFVYTRPQDKNYFRLALEEVGILGAGTVEYFQNQTSNERDWDLSFSADTFERKVAGRAMSFDSNKFGTNWVTHPFAGWLYYGAARGNRLGPFESLVVASLTSGIWEFLGEYREKVSINDLMVTPIAGAALSESMLQLGAWFERGRPTFARQALSWALSPTKRVHDLLDDAEPLRSPQIERGSLEARLHVAGGPTWENVSDTVRTDVNAGVRTHLFFGPSPSRPGRTHRWLDDGNLSTILLEGTMSNRSLVDARIATRVAYVGFYSKNVTRAEVGPVGHGMFLGIGTGLEYHWHRFDREKTAQDDQLALIELLGTTLENWHTLGKVRLRTEMILSLNFAGVHSLAADERIRRRGTAGLPTVLLENGYTHALGGTMGPSMRLSVPGLTFFGEARYDTFRSIIERDRYYESYEPTVRGAEERFMATGGLEHTFLPNLDVAVKVMRLFRRSRLEEVTRTAGETGIRFEAAVRL